MHLLQNRSYTTHKTYSQPGWPRLTPSSLTSRADDMPWHHVSAWKSHAVLAAAAVATFFGARALAPSSAGEKGGDGIAGSKPTAATNKPLPVEAKDAIARVQTASLADCEALLAGDALLDLPPLVREALFLRLAELYPRRLAELLLDKKTLFIGTRQVWLKWLATAHRDLLEEVAASLNLSGALKEDLKMTIASAEAEARSDPRKILEAALAKGQHPQTAVALGKLADSDPHLAIDYLELLLKSGALPTYLASGALVKMAEADPARMQGLVGQLKSPEQSLAMASAVARSLAATDPAAALAFIDSLPPSRTRSIAALDLVSAWSKRDPEAALAWIQKSLPEGTVRNSALALALAPLVESDPQRVLALLKPTGGSRDGNGSVNSYQTEHSSHGMSESSASALTNPAALRERALLALVNSDPPAAFAILGQDLATLAKGGDSFGRDDMNETAAKAVAAWMGKDPGAVIAWLGTVEDKTRSGLIRGLGGFFQDLPAGQAREGLAALDSFKSRNDARNFMLALAPSLAKADAAAAFASTDSLPEKFRNEWVEAVITQMAKADPAAAAKEVARLPENHRANVNATIATQMAQTSPHDAVAFLDSLPPTAKNAWAYRTAVSSWVNDQPAAAVAWWQELPPGDSAAREGALPHLAGPLYQADPSAAPQLVGMIAAMKDETERALAAASLVKAAAKADNRAALELMDSPDLNLSKSGRELLGMLVGNAVKR